MTSEEMRRTLHSFFDISKGRARDKIIHKRVREGAEIDGIHVCQLIAAMLIASIGLNTDSTEAVIGAMLICPLMGSVLAMAYSVATLDHNFLRESLMGLVVQVVVCLATSTLYFVISPLSKTTNELLANSTPTVWVMLIAFVGGFAGAVGTSRRLEPSTLIAGVAVATALMPPLCATGYGIAIRDWAVSASAFYTFLINVLFIAFGAAVVLALLRVPLVRDLNGDGVVTEAESIEAEREFKSRSKRLVIALIVFAIPCFFISARVVHKSIAENDGLFEIRDEFETEFTTYELRVVCPGLVSYRVGTDYSYDVEKSELVHEVVATVETKEGLSDTEKQQVEDLIRLHVEDLASVTFATAKG